MEDDDNVKNRIMQTLKLSPLPSKENYYKNNRNGLKKRKWQLESSNFLPKIFSKVFP